MGTMAQASPAMHASLKKVTGAAGIDLKPDVFQQVERRQCQFTYELGWSGDIHRMAIGTRSRYGALRAVDT